MKAEPLAERGAKLASNLADLANCDIVFTMVSTQDVLRDVLFGSSGIFSGNARPAMVVDCSSISVEVSAEIRQRLATFGTEFVAAPVSGNGKCVKGGKLSIVASGPKSSFEKVRSFLETIGPMGVQYVGEGELSRVAKICHNVFLGVVTQSLSELTVLAEKAGISRNAFHVFMNNSVMGSVFSRYKAPAFVNLDYTTTFTPALMQKDMDLGLSLGRKFEVPMPTASATRDVIQASMDDGNVGDVDFSVVFDFVAKSAGLELKPEDIQVKTGLELDDAPVDQAVGQ